MGDIRGSFRRGFIVTSKGDGIRIYDSLDTHRTSFEHMNAPFPLS
jgi:hypothetical protein